MQNKKHDYQIWHSAYDYVMPYVVYDKTLYGIKKCFKDENGKTHEYKTGLNESRIASFEKKEDAEDYIYYLNNRPTGYK